MTTSDLFPDSPAEAAQRTAAEHRARVASLVQYVARCTLTDHERRTLTTALEQLHHQMRQDLTVLSGMMQLEAP